MRGCQKVRRLGSQEQQVMPLTEAIAVLAEEAVPPDLKRAVKKAARSAA